MLFYKLQFKENSKNTRKSGIQEHPIKIPVCLQTRAVVFLSQNKSKAFTEVDVQQINSQMKDT